MELDDIETEDNPMDMTDEEVESIKAELHVPGTNTEIATLQEQAKQLSKEYDKQIDDNSNYNDPLAGIMPMDKYYKINVEYQKVASEMILPIFILKQVLPYFQKKNGFHWKIYADKGI